MPWHLNSDRPIYTRHPEPARWAHSRDLLDLFGVTKTMYAAVHEAAHATFSLMYGISVDYVILYSEAESDQVGVDASTYHGDINLPYGQYATILAGGERAQDRWLRETKRWTPGRAWSTERDARHDREQLEMTLAGQGARITYGTNPSSITDYAWVCDQTDQALERPWNAILAVAHELTTRKRTTGAQIQKVIDRC